MAKTMVSWQAFPSFTSSSRAPRVSLAPQTPFPFPFKRLPRRLQTEYRKIPKISPGAYIFQGPFLRDLFLEGPLFGGAYERREICVIKSVGLDCSGEEIYHFHFVLHCIRGQIPSTSPPGGLYSEGRFNGGVFASQFWGAYIWRGLYMEGLIFGILRYYCKKVRRIMFTMCSELLSLPC